jgi:hypothetical protein
MKDIGGMIARNRHCLRSIVILGSSYTAALDRCILQYLRKVGEHADMSWTPAAYNIRVYPLQAGCT